MKCFCLILIAFMFISLDVRQLHAAPPVPVANTPEPGTGSHGRGSGLECVRESTGWRTLVNGRTYSVDCPEGYLGVSCVVDYYDTNNVTNSYSTLTYHGFGNGRWMNNRTRCESTMGDGGITEGAVTAECCRVVTN